MTSFVVFVLHILHLFEGFYSDSLFLHGSSKSICRKLDCVPMLATFALVCKSPLLVNKACPIFIL